MNDRLKGVFSLKFEKDFSLKLAIQIKANFKPETLNFLN